MLRARVTQLWQTRMLRSAKLTVDDEIENALSYYRTTFLEQIPRLYRDLEEALPGHEIASFFRMGSWIGGDRDGNPFVGAATLATALSKQSETALRFYLTQVHELGAELSLSATLVEVAPALQRWPTPPATTARIASTSRTDRALIGVYGRLAATLQALTGTEALRHAVAPSRAYDDAAELLADLRTIEASLVAHHAGALVRPRLRRCCARCRCSASTSRPSTCARAPTCTRRSSPSCCGGPPGADYRALDENARRALLLRLLADARPLRVVSARRSSTYTEATRDELAVFEAAAQMHRRYGRDALRHYIISQTESVTDLLEVLLLLKEIGLLSAPRRRRRRTSQIVSPLFETIADLRSAPAIMREYFALPGIARDGAALGDVQDVMLGYSDSNKDGGYIHLQLGALQGRDRAGRVFDALRASRRRLRFFHGRGGTVGRGGGPELRCDPRAAAGHRAGRAAPHRAGRGDRLASTRNREIGRRNLETLVAATLEATLLPADRSEHRASFHAAMEELSAHAMAAYRHLVYETDGFVDYFRATTPIGEITELNIGSRPASRKPEPRHRGPARDPVGVLLGAVPRDAAGLVRLRLGDRRLPRRAASARERLALLQQMARAGRSSDACSPTSTWCSPRATSAIAARYVGLVEDRARRGASSGASRPNASARAQRYARHRRARILASNPALARSIEHRFPYLDPLNHLQVELIRRYRARRAGDGSRARAARHPPLDQRARGGAAQPGLISSRRRCAGPVRRRGPDASPVPRPRAARSTCPTARRLAQGADLAQARPPRDLLGRCREFAAVASARPRPGLPPARANSASCCRRRLLDALLRPTELLGQADADGEIDQGARPCR